MTITITGRSISKTTKRPALWYTAWITVCSSSPTFWSILTLSDSYERPRRVQHYDILLIRSVFFITHIVAINLSVWYQRSWRDQQYDITVWVTVCSLTTTWWLLKLRAVSKTTKRPILLHTIWVTAAFDVVCLFVCFPNHLQGSN